MRLADGVVIALISSVGALGFIALTSTNACAVTHYVDADWDMTVDTTLTNDTWYIRGNLTVTNCTLRLESAKLMMYNYAAGSRTRLFVGPNASLVAVSSRISLLGLRSMLVLAGDVRFVDSTLDGYGDYISHQSINQTGGSVTFERCTLDMSCQMDFYASLVIRDCKVTTRSGMINWMPHGYCARAPDGRRHNALIERTQFGRDTSNSSGTISLGSPVSAPSGEVAWGDWAAIIRNCTFNRCTCPIWVSGSYRLDYSVLVENNTALKTMEYGVSISEGGRILLRNNRWQMMYDDYGSGLSLWHVHAGWEPVFENETIEGGLTGVCVTGSRAEDRQALVLTGLFVHSCWTGVAVYDAEVDLVGCTLRALEFEVHAHDGAWVHLKGCNHTRLSCASDGGEVAELVDVEVLSLEWQNNERVLDGIVRFEPGHDYAEGQLDARSLGTVWLPVWIRTALEEVEVTLLRGYMRVEDHFFWTDYLHGPLASLSIDLTLYDDSCPELTVRSPLHGCHLNRSTVEASGEVRDLGTGLSSIHARVDGCRWSEVTAIHGTRWTHTIADLGEGTHLLEVKAYDRVGLTTLVKVQGIVVDTVTPSIAWAPSARWFNHSPVTLRFTTEPGATACFEGRSMPLTAYGTFSVRVDLVDGDNEFKVLVVDGCGNMATATVLLTLDTVPPALRFTRPVNMSWSRDRTVLVEGLAEPGASVEVNGHAAYNFDGIFRQSISGEGGTLHILARAYDPAGNLATAELWVRIDTMPPVVLLESILDIYTTTSRSVTVYGSVEEQNLEWVRPTRGNLTLEGGGWALEATLDEGENPLGVTARDYAGNEGAVSFRIVRDTEGPVVTATLLTDTGRVDPGEEPSVCGNASALLTVTVGEDCQLTLKGVWSIDARAGEVKAAVPLQPGENELVLFAKDWLGNRGPNVTFNVVRDVEPPLLEVVEPLGDAWVETPTFVVRGRTEPGARLIVGGIEAVADPSGKFSVEVGLREGRNEILVVARDRFGNEARRALSISYAKPAPWKRIEEEAVPLTAMGAAVGLLGLLAVLLLMKRSARRARGRGPPPARRSPDGPKEEPAGDRIGSRVRRSGG